jgi:hypothetical protein
MLVMQCGMAEVSASQIHHVKYMCEVERRSAAYRPSVSKHVLLLVHLEKDNSISGVTEPFMFHYDFGWRYALLDSVAAPESQGVPVIGRMLTDSMDSIFNGDDRKLPRTILNQVRFFPPPVAQQRHYSSGLRIRMPCISHSPGGCCG